MGDAAGGQGCLLVVGTPIGNLGDLSARAGEALRSADLVIAEDTRMAARLLAHLDTRTETISFNAHNARARLPQLVARLTGGARVALTTDAGMPGVSDPGAMLVAAAREAQVRVEVIPGPSAVTAAMALAGVEAAGFVFGGFLPARPAAARRTALERLLDATAGTGLPLVLFEAPHRIRQLLRDLGTQAATAHVAVCRELTKRHEEVLTGSPAEVSAQLEHARGEFTLVISRPAADERPATGGLDAAAVAVAAAAQGIGTRSIAELLRAGGLPRRQAYELAAAAADKGALSER